MGNEWVDSLKAVKDNRVVMGTDHITMTYEDTTAKLIQWLPKGAIILDVLCDVTTLFNAGTNDYICVGTSDNDDLYADDLDVSSTGMKAESQNTTPVVPGARLTEDTAIYAIYQPTGTNPTTGAATVSLVWVPSNLKPGDS